MLKNKIKSFEKKLKELSGSEIKVFDELVEMIISLLKAEVTANQSELMERAISSIDFDSIEDIQEFLSGYFNLQNEIIKEFDSLHNIENDADFNKEILKFTKTILQTIPKKELQPALAKSMLKVYTFVLDMYNIEIYEDETRTAKSINDAFEDEDLTAVFLTTSAIVSMFNEDTEMSFDEMVQLSSPFFIFCMAMNKIKKDDYPNSQEHKKMHTEPANEINYNAGRNEPCPCGSGKKYKKCCLIKQQTNPMDLISSKEPTDTPNSLSEKETTEFYTIWSKLINYTSHVYSGIYEKRYTPIYKKDKHGKFLVATQSLKDNYCLDVRDFMLNNFYGLVEDFLSEYRVTKQQESELFEFRDFYKSSQYYSFEKFSNGNAIFWDTQSGDCYYVNRCYDSLSTLLPKYAVFNTTLLPFRGRIVCDGLIGSYGMEIETNMQNGLKEEYKKDRDIVSFELEKNEKKIDKIYQLKISIKGAKPPIWRRVLVHSHTSFYELHNTIQSIFNWENCHLYEFVGNIATYTETLEEDFGGFKKQCEADKFSIESELKTEKESITYTYDFGDDWEHTILLEKILIADEEITYPVCTGGRRAGPLEDCGGIYMYNDIANTLENINAKRDENLEEHIEHMGDMDTDFDPSFFEKELVNRNLRGI